MNTNEPTSQDWPDAGIQAAIAFLGASSESSQPLSIIDVGGHQGETLNAFARNLDEFSYIGFEPNPDCYEKLSDMAASLASNHRQITTRNCAVGAENGQVQFNVTRATAVAGILKPIQGLSERVPMGDHEIAKVIECDVCTIDSLPEVADRSGMDLLKIDTEGFDLEVMKGAKNNLSNAYFGAVLSEVFFVPYREEQAFFWDLASFMQSVGYHFVNLYDCRNTGQGRLYTGNALWLSGPVADKSGFL